MSRKEIFENNPTEEINRFLVESNAIEGIYDDDSLKQAQFSWEYLISQKELTVANILRTHHLLVINQNLKPEHKGNWRNCRVWVGNYEGPDHKNIPNLIQSWLDQINTLADLKLTPEEQDLLLQDLHVQYEQIHPFADGNGRTGRMFWNFLRLKAGLPIKIIYEKDRFDYYRLFQKHNKD